MSAARMATPKLASFIGTSTTKVARPMIRGSFKPQTSARGFSGTSQGINTKPAVSPFQALKRQQASQILNHTTRNAMRHQSKRFYSSEIASAMVQVSQNMGMGSAAIGLGGAGIGIGLVFGALLLGVARNPALRGQLFTYAILGFAFVEAIGLFDLMVAMYAIPPFTLPAASANDESRMCKYV
ncbi:MAG: hypothetical protein MMC23_007321 [Stictis urceolatum]|nr:hypothetical protein [Stictis urceolata]